MLRTRLVSSIVLIPLVVLCIYLGRWPLLAMVGLLWSLAEIEFCQLVARNGFHAAPVFGISLIWLYLLDAQLPESGLLRPGLVLILLTALTWQLFHRRGWPTADWALSVASGLYLGLCGACLLDLRALNDGVWWTMTAIPAIMLADSGAFFVGRRWGRHKLAPTLSPGKTWEGYIAGIITGGVATALLAAAWRIGAGADSAISWGHGLILGVIIAVLAPLGDLAISMVKRQAGVKDSGNLIPGHGGALDRIDSIMWAAVLGYFYVLLVIR